MSVRPCLQTQTAGADLADCGQLLVSWESRDRRNRDHFKRRTYRVQASVTGCRAPGSELPKPARAFSVANSR